MAQTEFITAASGALKPFTPVFVDTIADLRLITEPWPVVFVNGHTTAEDGGGGEFHYLGIGANPLPIGSGGADDNGWHIVNAGGMIWGRISSVIKPEMFGAFGKSTAVLARANTDQAAAFQRAVTFWANPTTTAFPGLLFWGTAGSTFPKSMDFECPTGLYRCDSTITLLLAGVEGVTYSYENHYAPGSFTMSGMVFTPYTSIHAGIKFQGHRTAARPKMVLKAYKDVHPTTGVVAWDTETYPTLYCDDLAFRAWAANTIFYAGERFKRVIGLATWIYEVTVTGDTGAASAPTDITGADVVQGGCTFHAIGTSRITANNKTLNDCIVDSDDIGIHIDFADCQDDITCSAFNYRIAIGLVPKALAGSYCGWNTIKITHAMGAQVSVLIGCYMAHRVTAAAGRLALVNFPIGGIVWETTGPTDVGVKYIFNGPLGAESVSGNWVIDTTRATEVFPTDVGWVNDNHIDLHLLMPTGQGTARFANSHSWYGVVATSFGYNYPPNNNMFTEGCFEPHTSSAAALYEYACYLLYSGVANKGHSRADAPNTYPSVIIPDRAVAADRARLNQITSANDTRDASVLSYKKSRGNGCHNSFIGGPYAESSGVEKTIIYADSASFSRYDLVYWSDLSNYWRDPASPTVSPTNYTYMRRTGILQGAEFNPADNSWDFSAAYNSVGLEMLPMIMIDLQDNHMNFPMIRLEPILSHASGLTATTCFCRWVAYALTENDVRIDPTLFTSIPVSEVSRETADWPITGSTTYKYIYANVNRTTNTPYLLCPANYVKKLAIGLTGMHIIGFRVRVTGVDVCSIYSPFHRFSGMDTDKPLTDYLPEKGIIQAPRNVRYRSGSEIYPTSYFNKTPGQKYYCTSGLKSGLTPGNHYMWAHESGAQGSGVIQRYNGATWDTIATNAYYTYPNTDYFVSSPKCPTACIYCVDAVTAQTPAQNVFTKVTGFTTNGSSFDCTPTAASDKITIVRSGVYQINFDVSYTADDASTVEWFIYAGSPVAKTVLGTQNLLGTSDIKSAGISGLLTLVGTIGAVVGNDVEVWFKSNDATPSITPKHMQLTVTKVA